MSFTGRRTFALTQQLRVKQTGDKWMRPWVLLHLMHLFKKQHVNPWMFSKHFDEFACLVWFFIRTNGFICDDSITSKHRPVCNVIQCLVNQWRFWKLLLTTQWWQVTHLSVKKRSKKYKFLPESAKPTCLRIMCSTFCYCFVLHSQVCKTMF